MSENAETLGRRLQEARGKKGLSAQKAADALHLDDWVIEGLESGNYERIGPSVYAKGHLRRYAAWLGLPVAEVLADFDGSPTVIPPPPQPAGMRMRTSATGGRKLPWPSIVALVLVVLVLIGTVGWRRWHRRVSAAPPASADSVAPPGRSPGEAPVGPSPAAAAAAGAGAVPSPTGVAGTGTAGTVGSVGAVGAANSVLAPVAAATDPKAASGRARLRLSFVGDSWADVHDAMGRRLFAGNGRANNVRSMSGEAPFRVYLKAASSVRLEINNHTVAIGAPYVVGNVARFEAGADGVLRRDPHVAPIK